jgi:glycerol-3-phosphate O-acyltransferase
VSLGGADRPVQEAENRLAGFNRERDAIVNEVVDRVTAERVASAAGGGDASLEYVLNEVAYQEIRRLESGLATGSERKRLPEWRELARALGTMSEREKRERLGGIVREHASDVAGNFDERVYRFAKGILPALLGGLLAPQTLTQARLSEGLSGLTKIGGLSTKIVVDGPLDELRRCADRGTLVVVPTHSSNMDSVVLGWSLQQAGLPPVTYGAGKNLFSNRFISYFMHNLGAYRVDRRLRHALYKDVLKTYSTVLLERGYHSLFFPGGTRSRSGAVEKRLKLGLLGTAIAAWAKNLQAGAPQRRIYVVPATINYAITLEAETLVDDHLAEEGKHRYIIEDDEFSSLGRLVDYSRKVLAMDGGMVIRYGAPLDPFGNRVDAEGESIDQRGRRVDPATYLFGAAGAPAGDDQRDSEYTRALGDELVGHYRRLTVLMPTHLVARVLYDAIVKRQKTRDVYRLLRLSEDLAVPIDDVRAGVDRLRGLLVDRPMFGSVAPHAHGQRPGDLVDDALRAFRAYHTRPVAERDHERIVVRHMRLLHYYQNRTAHIPAGALA